MPLDLSLEKSPRDIRVRRLDLKTIRACCHSPLPKIAFITAPHSLCRIEGRRRSIGSLFPDAERSVREHFVPTFSLHSCSERSAFQIVFCFLTVPIRIRELLYYIYPHGEGTFSRDKETKQTRCENTKRGKRAFCRAV